MAENIEIILVYLCGQDLQAMKIGSQHVYKIWRSLVEYRNCVMEVPTVPAATSDYLYAVIPAGASGLVTSGRDADQQTAVFAPTAGGDIRLCDARPPGRARLILKDDHNYC